MDVSVVGDAALPPGYQRAIDWVKDQHSHADRISCAEYLDRGNVGWLSITVSSKLSTGRMLVKHYVASPTGRVWRANFHMMHYAPTEMRLPLVREEGPE